MADRGIHDTLLGDGIHSAIGQGRPHDGEIPGVHIE